jgi:hypothetical protein
MRKVSFKSIMLALGALSLVVVGCKKDEVNPTDVHEHNDGELITTLELKFSGKGVVNKDTTFVVTFDDPDGDGKDPIKFDQINLLKDTDYSVEVTLLDKSKTPYDTISNEVLEEADDHLFFYSSTPVDLFEYITIEDKDSKLRALGLRSIWKTKPDVGSGTVKVKLMHQPGLKDGKSEVGGTDVEVEFPVVIK